MRAITVPGVGSGPGWGTTSTTESSLRRSPFRPANARQKRSGALGSRALPSTLRTRLRALLSADVAMVLSVLHGGWADREHVLDERSAPYGLGTTPPRQSSAPVLTCTPVRCGTGSLGAPALRSSVNPSAEKLPPLLGACSRYSHLKSLSSPLTLRNGRSTHSRGFSAHRFAILSETTLPSAMSCMENTASALPWKSSTRSARALPLKRRVQVVNEAKLPAWRGPVGLSTFENCQVSAIGVDVHSPPSSTMRISSGTPVGGSSSTPGATSRLGAISRN